MGRKEKKYHFIYKTTNIINRNFYIGMHSTDDLNDGYIGSGKRLWHSINYHGKKNFKFEIIEFLPNRNSLKEREKDIINEELLKNPYCMNLKKGGDGGAFYHYTDKIRKKIGLTNSIKQKGAKNSQYGTKWVTNGFENRKIKKDEQILNGWHEGRALGESFSKKMSEKLKGLGVGNKNSQFGTCWITNDIINKKIKKTDPIPDGWKLGRKLTRCS